MHDADLGAPRLSLFDEVERYSGPARHAESSFHFLNRAADEWWRAVRELLESWYARYPDDTGDLRARFRQDDPRQHVAAWWELYIYVLFERLGYVVDIHPGVDGTFNTPDFRLSNGTQTMYVECAVLFEDASEAVSDSQAWLFDCINEANSADFIGTITVEQTGSLRPSMREILEPINSWLASLDWHEVDALVEESGEAPEATFDIRGWRFTLDAWPVNADNRGETGRFIGSYLVGSEAPRDDERRLRNLIAKKGSRYGSAQPLVLAVLAWSSFIDERDLTCALFGSVVVKYYESSSIPPWAVRERDGYWRPDDPQKGARLGGVLFGTHLLKPSNPIASLPTLWVNPWAVHPIGAIEPFGWHTVNDDGISLSGEATRSSFDVFGIEL